MYSRPLLSLRASYALGSNKTDERFLRKNNSGQALAIPLRVAITFSVSFMSHFFPTINSVANAA